MPDHQLNPEALEAACAGFYNDPLGLTNWQRLCSADPALADKYRAGMNAVVSAYLAALPAPRTITTVEELEALPTSTYVEDMHGDRGIVFNEHIWYPETKPLLLGYALKHYGPFTVLWVPTEGGGE